VSAASATGNPAASGLRLPLALSIAFRELRAGAGGLTIFVLCISLGVAAVAAIGSLSASFDQALARQGRISEARGEAEHMVNEYPGTQWALDVERNTGAHPHR